MKVFDKNYAMVYDSLYKDKDYEKECNFIETIFTKRSENIRTILDLGCGTGGHALILAKRGYEVVGIDRAKDMLKIANLKAKQENFTIKFIHGDITDIDLQMKFDAVISMFAVMSYQTTNAALAGICSVAKKHLVPGGLFIFDCWYGPAVLSEKPGVCIKEVKLNGTEKIVRFTEPILNTLTHTVETRFKIWNIRNGHLISETKESHLMRFLYPLEIKYFLEVAGFNKIEFCPFLELERQLSNKDWNMTVIAKASRRRNARQKL